MLRMSFDGKKLNIGPVVTATFNRLDENIRLVTGGLFTTISKLYNNKDFKIYIKEVNNFLTSNYDIILLVFYMFVTIYLMFIAFRLNRLRESTRENLKLLYEDSVKYNSLRAFDAANGKIHFDLLKYYKEIKNSRKDLREELGTVSNSFKRLVKTTESLNNLNKNANELEENISTSKLEKIEEIMVDGCYNDPEYLVYDGEEWTMSLLEEKAVQMEIPIYSWKDRKALQYVIRLVEQFKKIEDIVQPFYPDGYETQEMEGDSDHEI